MIKQTLKILSDGTKEKAQIAIKLAIEDKKNAIYWQGQHDAYMETAKMLDKIINK